jgi:hypothetical protein
LNTIQSNFRITMGARSSRSQDDSFELELEEMTRMQLILADVQREYEEPMGPAFFDNLNPIVTTAVGTGVVIWLIHASQVAAAVLSTASAWVQLDPLTVLQGASLGDEANSAEEMLFDSPQGQGKEEANS